MSKLPRLPLAVEVETKPVLRAAARAHRYLAELKGAAATIPNQGILIDTLGLQEAKDSSAIEQIITTDDEFYQARVTSAVIGGPAAKKVERYAQALYTAPGSHRVSYPCRLGYGYVLAFWDHGAGDMGRKSDSLLISALAGRAISDSYLAPTCGAPG